MRWMCSFSPVKETPWSVEWIQHFRHKMRKKWCHSWEFFNHELQVMFRAKVSLFFLPQHRYLRSLHQADVLSGGTEFLISHSHRPNSMKTKKQLLLKNQFILKLAVGLQILLKCPVIHSLYPGWSGATYPLQSFCVNSLISALLCPPPLKSKALRPKEGLDFPLYLLPPLTPFWYELCQVIDYYYF